MKKRIFAFLTFIIFFVNSCIINKKVDHNKKNTAFFVECSNGYDSVINYSISSVNGLQPLVTLRRKKNQEWIKTKYISRTGYGLSDSSYNSDCNTCVSIVQDILKCGLLSLPTETQLTTDCKFVKDTVLDGNTVTEVRDLNSIADIEKHTIEYKFGKTIGFISYRSPIVALQICPASPERLQFLAILNSLAGIE